MTIDRFELVKALDDQRSLVRNKHSRTKRLVVLKGINVSRFPEIERQAFIDHVRNVAHPQLVRVIDAFEDDGRICVVEECREGGTLKQLLALGEPLNEDQITDILAQIVMSLVYLHERNLVHGEIWAENVLFSKDKSSLKLGSVGFCTSNSLPPSIMSSYSAFMAPELWQWQPFSPATDIWALGCLLHHLFTGMDYPFGSFEESPEKMPELIENGQPFPIKEEFSEDLRVLCYRMLNKNPQDRPTAREISEDMWVGQKIANFLRPRPPSATTVDTNRTHRREEDAGSSLPAVIPTEAEQGPIERPSSSFSRISLHMEKTEPLSVPSFVDEGTHESSSSGGPSAGTPATEAPPPIAPPIQETSPTTAVPPAVVQTHPPSSEIHQPPSGGTAQPAMVNGGSPSAKRKTVNGTKPHVEIKAEPKTKPPAAAVAPSSKPAAKAKPPPSNNVPAPVKATAPPPPLPKGALTKAGSFMNNSKNGVNSSTTKLSQPSARVTFEKSDVVRAAERGDLARLRDIIRAGADIEEMHPGISSSGVEENSSALHRVAESGRIDVAVTLLDLGAKVDSLTPGSKETPFFRACRACQIGVAQVLYNRGANVEVKCTDDLATPLHVATTYGHVVIMRFLLEVAHADINSRNKSGHTPLHIAAKYGDVPATWVCLENKADLNAKEFLNEATPLHRAAAFDSVDVARMLVESGASTEARTKLGQTPLHWAAENNHDCVALLLLNHNAAVEAKEDQAGATSLHLAASLGHVKIMRLLIDRGANLDAKDEKGRTPLMWACQKKQLTAGKLLIDRGANVKAKDDDRGCTALHLSASVGHVEMMTLLLEKGSPMDARSKLGRTPLHWACESGQKEVVQFLLQRKANIRLRDDENEATPLFDATAFGHEHVAKLLLDNGASANEKAAYGLTPLHAAAESGSVATVQVLLDHGAKIDATDSDKETALHRAAAFGRVDVVKKLVDRGADVNVKTLQGMTAYEIALKLEDEAVASEIADFLKSR